MAEGLLRAKAGDRFDVRSAGTEPAAEVNPIAVEAMREIGLDIRSHRPKNLAQFLGKIPVAHLITVCHDADQKCPTIWPGVLTRVHWPIEDPAAFRGDREAALQKFRAARDEISRRLDAWLAAAPASAR
jgi:arsenate reductase